MKAIIIVFLLIYIGLNFFNDIPKYFHFIFAIVIILTFYLDFFKAKKI